MIAEPTCDLCGTPAHTPPADPAPSPADPGPSPAEPAPSPVDPGPSPVDPGPSPVEPGLGPALPLTWTTAVENGRLRVFCATCSRTHLRAIEGKLDSAWW